MVEWKENSICLRVGQRFLERLYLSYVLRYNKHNYERQIRKKRWKWREELKKQHTFTKENTAAILKVETGKIFAKVLEHAGVYQRNAQGAKAFDKFVKYVNEEV